MFMVEGTVINDSGNETGVVVNGIIAHVYGNQFVANDGHNTIVATATGNG